MVTVLDEGTVQEMHEMATALGPDFLARICLQFDELTADTCAGLRSALDGGDAEAFRHHAHTLKGASSMIGAHEVASIAAVLELTHWTAPGAELREPLERLSAAVLAARHALHHEFAPRPP